jgi:PAS domain-containing protein
VEKSIIESEKVFRELFDNMSSGVAVYESINGGEDFIFKDLNKAGEEISQVIHKEIIGKKITEIFPGIKELGLLNVFQRVWKTGKSEHHPISQYKDKRITNWVENYVYKLPSGLIVAIYDDVSGI